MKRLGATVVAVIAAVGLVVVPPGGPASAQQPPVARRGLIIEPTNGWDVYTRTSGSDYRVGPTLVRSPGSSEVWQLNCGPAFASQTDVIRRMWSYDAGRTFVGQTTLLQPTPGSPDSAGVCDPTLVRVGDDFFLAYTGLSAGGTRQVFVARSKGLDGPYFKWNGDGWGGEPAPLGLAQGVDGTAGPSLVVKDGLLHLFFQKARLAGGTFQTRVATADVGDPATLGNWPARLSTMRRPAILHPQRYAGVDCVGGHWFADTDVKYDEASGRFIAVTTDQTYPWTVLQAYESVPGDLTFVRSTITRGDYQPGARTPGILGDWSGHVPAGAPTAIAYARSTSCGSADLHWSTTVQRQLTTGAISEPLATSAARWTPRSGSWRISPGGYYEQTQGDNATFESSLNGRFLSSASYLAVTLKTQSQSASRVGLHFNKAHPDDSVDESGYLATVSANGDVCLSKAGYGILECVRTMIPVWVDWVQLRIVQADGAIKVYLNGDSGDGLAFTDDDHPFLGGYLGLVTRDGTGTFANLQAGDNVPGRLAGVDWQPSHGSWTAADGRLNSHGTAGQSNLQDKIGLASYVPTQLGDGTFGATVRMPASPSDPRSWVGVAVTLNAMGDWGHDGYLVFLRANGNLGVYRGGTGQVVADVPTGVSPVGRDVRLRIAKTRANLQVYVDDRPVPVVNWTDPQRPYWSVGGFGVANLGTPGSFRDLTYDGDYSR